MIPPEKWVSLTGLRQRSIVYLFQHKTNQITFQILVIIDAKPKDLGLPTEAYIAVEEVHDVSVVNAELIQ